MSFEEEIVLDNDNGDRERDPGNEVGSEQTNTSHCYDINRRVLGSHNR